MHAATPMWRNGRRNGLKIRFRVTRSMGSNPIIGTSEKRFYEAKSVNLSKSSVAQSCATKSTKTKLICQVFVKRHATSQSK